MPGKTKRLQSGFFEVVTGITVVMMSAFMGLVVGGGIVLMFVGVAWIVTAGRELRAATDTEGPGPQPSNAKEGVGPRKCELCDAEVSGERTDLRCPLIEAYVLVRSESIGLDDWGVRADGGDAEPGVDGLGQG